MENPLDYRKQTYFQTDRTLRYSYSLRYLNELEQLPEPDYTYDLLAYAPSFDGAGTLAELRRAIVSGEGRTPRLQPLAHNQTEAEQLAEQTRNSAAYLGSAATLAAFRENAGQGRVLHLSTHGLVDATDPRLSFLAFYEGAGEPALLYFNELAALDLDAELVVLSACETSLGDVAPGENVLSLGSAFAAGGARSTVSTLWPVSDRATEDLMLAFYDNLRAGMDRAPALAAAQDRLRDGDFAHPYYWAATLLHGRDGAVDLPGGGVAWYWWGLGLLGLLGLFALVLRRGK